MKSFKPAMAHKVRFSFKRKEGPFLSICESLSLCHTEAKPLSNSQEERSAFENKVTLTQTVS